MFIKRKTAAWAVCAIPAVTFLNVTAFSQTTTKPLEVRTYYSDDGQVFQINSVGQILGFEKPKACLQPQSPDCSKIGLVYVGRNGSNKQVSFYTGDFQPINRGFAADAPPTGTKIGANGVLKVQVRSATKAPTYPWVAFELDQTIEVRPATKSIDSTGVTFRPSKRKPALPDAHPPEWTLMTFERLAVGCECDPPGPDYVPHLFMYLLEGLGQVTQLSSPPSSLRSGVRLLGPTEVRMTLPQPPTAERVAVRFRIQR